jgi:large repetitive protein
MARRGVGPRLALAMAVAACLVGGLPATVTAAAEGPVAQMDRYGTTVDRRLQVREARGLLANDLDPVGGGLYAVLDYQPNYGRVDVRPNGSITYTPLAGWEGIDLFGYHVIDAEGNHSTTAMVAVVVNGPPVAVDDTYRVIGGEPLDVPAPGILGNDIEHSGATLRVITETGTTNGRLRLRGDGSFRYVPNPGFQGEDRATYRVSDGQFRSAVAEVVFRVSDENAPPVAVGEYFELGEDNWLDVGAPGLLVNDSDPDGDALTAEIVSYPAFGNLDFRDDGSFVYEPVPDFDSDVSFTYRVFDGVDYSEAVTVEIDMYAINDPPIAEDDSFEGLQDEPLVVPSPGVLGNDYDPVEGDSLTASGPLSGPSFGTVTIDAGGGFTYTPDPGYVGYDSFAYGVLDSQGGGASANVQIYIYENA